MNSKGAYQTLQKPFRVDQSNGRSSQGKRKSNSKLVNFSKLNYLRFGLAMLFILATITFFTPQFKLGQGKLKHITYDKQQAKVIIGYETCGDIFMQSIHHITSLVLALMIDDIVLVIPPYNLRTTHNYSKEEQQESESFESIWDNQLLEQYTSQGNSRQLVYPQMQTLNYFSTQKVSNILYLNDQNLYLDLKTDVHGNFRVQDAVELLQGLIQKNKQTFQGDIYVYLPCTLSLDRFMFADQKSFWHFQSLLQSFTFNKEAHTMARQILHTIDKATQTLQKKAQTLLQVVGLNVLASQSELRHMLQRHDYNEESLLLQLEQNLNLTNLATPNEKSVCYLASYAGASDVIESSQATQIQKLFLGRCKKVYTLSAIAQEGRLDIEKYNSTFLSIVDFLVLSQIRIVFGYGLGNSDKLTQLYQQLTELQVQEKVEYIDVFNDGLLMSIQKIY